MNGNGMSSWATVPGLRHGLTDRVGDGDMDGPVIRRDVLRLMLRVECLDSGPQTDKAEE